MKASVLLASLLLSLPGCGRGLVPLDGNAVTAAATSPNGARYLIAGASNGAQHRLLSYTVSAASGALTQVGSPVTANSSYVLAASSDGKWVIAVGGNQAQIFGVSAASGALTAINTVTLGSANLTFAAFHPSGRFVFATDGTSAPAAKIDTLTVDASAGTLALASTLTSTTVPALDYPHGVAVTPDGAFLYTANYAGGLGTGDKVLGFSINAATGALTNLAGSPFAAGAANLADPRNLTLSADGKHLYVVDESSAPTRVAHFALNTATGALTISGNATPGAGNSVGGGVAASADGKFVFATHRFGDTISAYAVNASTGNLTFAAVSNGGLATPISLGVHPELPVVYCANSASNSITIFGYATNTGTLTNFTGLETLVPGSGYTVDAVAIVKLAP
jgi:6-phosphogluconolactonase (cycloisomerase 2 family)